MSYLEYASFEPRQEPASTGGQYRTLDRAPQQVFDRLARLAAHCCHATAAVLVLPGEAETAATTSVYGLDRYRWLEDGVLQSRALEAGTLLEVGDAREDEQLASSMLVKEEPGVRLFAACPIGDGPRRGALLVMDTEPRHLSDAEREGLADLAALAAEEVEPHRQATAARMADSEHFQAKLLENVGQAVIATDAEGAVIYWNAAAEDLYGYTASEVMGRSILEVTTPEATREQGAEIFATLQAGERWVGEIEVRRRDGSTFWAYVVDTPVLDDEGRLTAIIGVSKDITARKEAEQALRESERRLHTVMDNAPLIFFVLDPDGRFLLMRGRGLDALGLEPDQLVGESAYDVYSAYPHVLDSMSRALNGEEVHVVFPLDELEMEVWYRPVTDAAGEVEEVVGIVLDVTDRERAVAELRRQRDLLKQTQRLAGAWEVDLRTGDVAWSEEIYRIHELPVGTEVDVGEALDFYAEASRRVVRAAFERTVNDGTPYDLELRLVTARGNRRWVRSVGAAVEEDGEVVKVVGAFQDITHRKEVELELRRSREHLEEAQRIAHLGSWTHDFEKDRVYWSDESRRIFGWGPNKPLTVENIMAAVPPDDWERLHQQRQALIERGEALDVEHRVIRPDGEERIVRLRGAVKRNADGEVVHVYGTTLDVTDQKRAEKQIRLQATALEAAANAIVITDRDGYITWVNPAFTELTGYAEDEVVGQSMRILRSGEQDPSFYKDLWKTVRAGSVWRGELVNRRKDGRLYVEEQTITPVRDENGIIHHFVAIKQDVTRRVEYEQGLDSARLRAEELNRLKDTVLMNMSHELRTPLATIIGYSDVLHGLVAEEHRELVEAVRRGGDRLLETLTLVLELAQVESGKRVLATSRFEVCQCVRDEVKGMRAPAEHEGVAVAVRVPDEQVWMTSDPSAVSRIVQCLLSNAIKFTPEGDVRVTVDASDASVQIEVADTGIGIAPEALPHLFEAFRQESSGIARNYEGSGVGLAVVQRLVTLLNGAVEVESQKGQGSTFRVTLPRHASASRPAGC